MSTIGHNGGPALADQLETLLSDTDRVKFVTCDLHISDWMAGTLGMDLEYEGAYVRFLMRLYDRGKPLPDDDTLMSRIMGISTRVWKRVKTTLVSLGKIIVRAGCLTNPRFEEERRKRAEEIRNRTRAAHERWEKMREVKSELAQSLGQVSPKFDASLDETLTKFWENAFEKFNEINHAAGKDADAGPKTPLSDPSGTLDKKESFPHTPFKEKINPNTAHAREEPTLFADQPPPPDEPEPAEEAEAANPKRKRQVPADWQPSEQCWAWARNGKIGATDAEIAAEVEGFRDRNRGRGEVYADFDAAFRNWMRNWKKYSVRNQPYRNGNAAKNGSVVYNDADKFLDNV